MISGETPPAERLIILDEYLKGHIDVLILTFGTGKYGLTLTNTRTVIHFDKTFNLDSFAQSIYRTERIGSTISTEVITFHIPNTVDELLRDNLLTKSQLAAKLTRSNVKLFLDNLGVSL